MKRLIAISSFAFSLVVCGSLYGEEVQKPATTELLFRQGYAEIVYDNEYIPTLGLKVGFKTMLLLPADEHIVRVEVGARGPSLLEIKYGANWVGLRPNIEKLYTNIHIATDQGRVYSFDLIEGGGPHKEPYKKVVILRPDMDLDAEGGPADAHKPSVALPVPQSSNPAATPAEIAGGRQLPTVVGMDDDSAPTPSHHSSSIPGADVLRKLDDDYKIRDQKPKVFSVKRVYNDGQRTFVIFKTAMLEAPLFYRIDPNGKREILTYRMEPAKDPRDMDVFVIPRLVDRGTVKIGDYESTFVWRKVE